MSDSPLHWFHCGRCGSLFQSQAGDLENRMCPKCGFSSFNGVMEATPDNQPVGANLPEPKAVQEISPTDKRTVRKRRSSYLMLKIVGGWSLLLAIIIFGAKNYFGGGAPQQPATVRTQSTQSSEDRKMLQDASESCGRTFSGFIAATTLEQRNQYVLTPVSTALRMARFYGLNAAASIDPQSIQLQHSGIINFPQAKAIEALWKAPNGFNYDAVFREESGEWRLDWEHFARFSDFPWSQFLAGDGPSEGEFRLLARERLAKERVNEPSISIVLYSPRVGRTDEEGYQSPEFLISRSRPEGRLLDAAFKLAREGGRLYGSTMPNIDPDDMIRLRVKVRRTEENQGRSFEITEIKACHWYSVDDVGVTPPEPPQNR